MIAAWVIGDRKEQRLSPSPNSVDSSVSSLSFAVFATFAAGCIFAEVSAAAVIQVGPSDNYSKIEAARAGDRLNPIKIHAQDPNNKPVWDFSSTLVESAPGSYNGGDRGRGGWQVSGGAYYQISGLVITGCTNADQDSAGLRYYGGTTGLYVSDCIFRQNDNGVTGGTQESDATFEFCDFDSNGNLTATSPTHNLYIYGGTFMLRYSYVHDSVEAEDFHIRAQTSFLEYNWFARAANYEGDLMTDDDFSGSGPFSQTMWVRGNVFIQSANPGNHSQVLVVFDDTGLPNENMSIQVVQNTYIGNGKANNGGGGAAFVHLSNANGTAMSATISNNIISGTTLPILIENSATASAAGTNNWLKTGVSPGPLTNSIFSTSPGFANPTAFDYTLLPGSAAVGQAAALDPGLLPTREYFQNQTVAREFRVRPAAKDLGAFETATTDAGLGPYDPAPLPSLTAARIGSRIELTWPLTAAGFALEQTPSLTGSTSWSEVPGAYVLAPGGFSVTIPISGPTDFFRLIKK
jgi:hypothetical protein